MNKREWDYWAERKLARERTDKPLFWLLFAVIGLLVIVIKVFGG